MKKNFYLINLAGFSLLSWGALFSAFYFYPMNRFPLAFGLICAIAFLSESIISLIILFGKKTSRTTAGGRGIFSYAGIALLIFVPLYLGAVQLPGYLFAPGKYNNAFYVQIAGALIILTNAMADLIARKGRLPSNGGERTARIIPPLFLLLTFIWTLFQGDHSLPERTGSYEPGQPSHEMRAEISPESPLFVFNIYGWDRESIIWLDENLPEDVRPNWAIQFVSLTEDKEENRSGAESALALCDELGFPAFIQIEHCLSRSDVPSEYLDSLFLDHQALIGLSVAEFSAANTSFYGMDYTHTGVISTAIDIVSTHGAYLMWQDMGYEFRHPISIAGSHKALYEKIAAHSRNMILVDKRNGRSKRMLTLSSILGFFLTDAVSNWGVNSEGWIWWEAGLGPLGKEPVGTTKAHRMWESLFTYPDSLFGTEWVMAASAGATVFSLEAPFQGLAALNGEKGFVPAWDEVILPVSRKILEGTLIAEKEELIKETAAAYLPDRVMPAEYCDDDLFKGLYGPSESSLYEWLPSTGRYGFLPVLPEQTPDEKLLRFGRIIRSREYSRNFSRDEKAKTAYFDELYPERSRGKAWVYGNGPVHYLANPEENRQEAADFSFSMEIAGEEWKIGGELSPGAFALTEERDGELVFYVNNFRVNSEESIWSYTDDSWDLKVFLDGNIGGFDTNRFDLQGYIAQLITDPDLDALRPSVLELDIPGSGDFEPRISVGRGSYSIEREENRIRIFMMHNGGVEIAMVKRGE